MSAARIFRFRNEAKDTFHPNAIARIILRQTRKSEGDGFQKIGFNNIVDRIWFVEGVFEGASYAAPNGAPYGSALAEVEARRVLDKLFEVARQPSADCVTETSDDPAEDDVYELLDTMRDKEFEPTMILASTKQVGRFWDFKGFEPSREVRHGLVFPEGKFLGVPVHYSRLLPDSVIIAIDSGSLGELAVKREFDIDVTDITDTNEQDRIRQNVPSLSQSDFTEKARILGYEIVKPTILETLLNVGAEIIVTNRTELQLKHFDK